MNNNNRYVQPKNAKDAMLIIEKLFNKYRNVPLTIELINYHQKLLNQLRNNIYLAVLNEKNDHLLAQLNTMIDSMESWLNIRTTNHIFCGKMKHFKINFKTNNQRYKLQTHKIKNHTNHRSVRH